MDPDIHQSYSIFFNEHYNISPKLVNRLVEKTMESSFPHSQKSPTPVKVTEHDIKTTPTFHGIAVHHGKSAESDIDAKQSAHDLQEESLHSIPIPLNYLDPLSPARAVLRPPASAEIFDEEDMDASVSSIPFGPEFLAEYSHLSETAMQCDGTIDLSHSNFGNHRIAILSEKLTQCERDHEVVSLCLRCVCLMYLYERDIYLIMPI